MENQPGRDVFVPLALLSILFALGAPVVLYFSVDLMRYAIALSFAWIVIIVAALIAYRRRALPLLVGAPFALFPPAILA
jgi:hypothetical protein